MKSSNGSVASRRRPTPPRRRNELIAAFDRSGLSAAAFAREHGIGYTTFCGWRQRRTPSQRSPAFVQVEWSQPAAPVELLLELGAHARLRITSVGQIELAAQLLHRLNAPPAC
jgi:transposase-like protein